jgi:4,5-dihydroxyphthalate decarboxylase
MPLPLTFASQSYDRIRALAEGRIHPDGVTLKHVELPPWHLFPRMIRDKEFEVSEMGLTLYVGTLGLDPPPFIALPVFLSRTFRRSQIYVSVASRIEKPTDLIGKRIGEASLHGHDAAVWLRGILADEHGVPFDSATYHVGGVNAPSPLSTWVPFKGSTKMRVEHIGPSRTLDAMLQAGEIDALYTAITPKSFLERSPRVRLLFEDAEPLERDFFRRTGVFPIMHLVVLRRDIYEANRWLARALYDAFKAAKQEAHDLYYGTYGGRIHLLLMIPLLTELIEANRKMMGDDPWPYGVAANRRTLEAFLRYHHEQGFSQRRFSPEELFAPETLAD